MLTGLTRRHGLTLVLAITGSLVPATAIAQGNYPERSVRMVIPFAPGGPADTSGRLFGPFLTKALGQNVVIENRPGASAVVGTQSVTRAEPDGYTLLFGSSSTFAVNPAVMTKLRFDVQKDLKFIRLVTVTPHVVVIRSNITAKSLAEFVALAKAQPGKFFYASSGLGGAIHLGSELFKLETGTSLNHVPFRGGGPAVLGVVQGDADLLVNDASTTLPNIQAGNLRPLVMLSPKRSPLLPDVPTSAELGYPGILSSSWTGLAVPVNTPAAIVARLAKAVDQVLALEDYQKIINRNGFELFGFNDEQTAAFIKAEVERWARVAKAANVRVD